MHFDILMPPNSFSQRFLGFLFPQWPNINTNQLLDETPESEKVWFRRLTQFKSHKLIVSRSAMTEFEPNASPCSILNLSMSMLGQAWQSHNHPGGRQPFGLLGSNGCPE